MMSSERLERRLNVLQYVIIALLAMSLVGPPVIIFWLNQRIPVVNTVKIDNVQMRSKGALCPGDAVAYSYSFHAAGSGVLVSDRVLWRMTPPPKTMIFSASRRFIITDPIDQELTEAWHVPVNYVSPETNTIEPLPPGEYRLIFAVSSPTRPTVISIASIYFNVREDCP